MKHTSCPSCYHNDINDFFEIKNAPVHSLVTIKDFNEANSVLRKDITLAFCNNCGFIFNSSFDTSLDYYTKGYEDQQGFSPTFVKFITGVTSKFIDRYDIRNKNIIEIGCGKGDFTALISELGNNNAIGIDPAWEPGRVKESPKVKFIKEFYSEKHGQLEADCICCRHTLEHIHDTGNFIKTVRKSIGDRKDVVVFMEIPNIIRILKVQAFWDIFYEHCTYFSPGSLARLFRMNNFEVLDLYLEYDNQYLFIEARPVDGVSDKIHPLEEPVSEVKTLTENFTKEVTKTLDLWKGRLNEFKKENKKVVVWGGGSKSVGFLTQFDSNNAIDYVVDINPHMQGNYIPGIGKKYVGPDFLKEYKPDVVIIMNSVYIEEIRKMLNERGLNPQLIGL
jgi:2-polyprenyl-3-methyl-5-hydroxy-6-metoxy-1,4-benzoquinol methylase